MFKLLKKSTYLSLIAKNNLLQEQLLASKNEKEKLNLKLYSSVKRNERIEFIINRCLVGNNELKYCRTSKDVPVILSFSYPKTIKKIDIAIYDIDTSNLFKGHSLILYAQIIDKEMIFIEDILGGESKGHGKLAMLTLIEFAQENHFKIIRGKIKQNDKNHHDRLKFFYESLGFDFVVDDTHNGFIQKILAE
jgi:hypothetical protein